MELIPARTAVIAVHMQHDVVSADGAFGGLFAARRGPTAIPHD